MLIGIRFSENDSIFFSLENESEIDVSGIIKPMNNPNKNMGIEIIEILISFDI
tara:strand:+ start:575 stop:733 length:159 start_codon:yes stop_codon:yes gene_type:complete